MALISFPQIQIRQQIGKIGIDADLGTQSIRQPKASLEMRSAPAKLEIRSPAGELIIDQSKAWDAYGVGPHLETMNRIYSEARKVALQGIARIVENGNKMADISIGTNAIADIARQLFFDFFEFDYAGEASVDNVDIFYTARKPEVHVIEGNVDIHARPNRPEIGYRRGKLDIYMLQYPKVEITPPKIDMVI